MKARLREMFAEYGVVGLILWYSVFGLTIGGAAVLVESGLHWSWLDEHVGSAGTWVAAYAIAKLLTPVRIALVAGILPFAGRLRRRFRPAAAPAAGGPPEGPAGPPEAGHPS